MQTDALTWSKKRKNLKINLNNKQKRTKTKPINLKFKQKEPNQFWNSNKKTIKKQILLLSSNKKARFSDELPD